MRISKIYRRIRERDSAEEKKMWSFQTERRWTYDVPPLSKMTRVVILNIPWFNINKFYVYTETYDSDTIAWRKSMDFIRIDGWVNAYVKACELWDSLCVVEEK